MPLIVPLINCGADYNISKLYTHCHVRIMNSLIPYKFMYLPVGPINPQISGLKDVNKSQNI